MRRQNSTMLRAKVTVTLKPDVMDPQGTAVCQALKTMGHGDVQSVRVGRFFEVKLEGNDEKSAREQIKSMCEALLSNTVIERYDIAIEPIAEKAASAR